MRHGGELRVVALSIPAKAEYVALCRLALTGLARLGEIEPERVADLKLALTEACSNSIRHAYGEGREGVVDVRYEVTPEQIAIEVADAGPGFDAPAPADGDPLDEGGLGLAIIRAVTDELGIQSDGHVSRLRFVKYLD